jgi:hypothetical protein
VQAFLLCTNTILNIFLSPNKPAGCLLHAMWQPTIRWALEQQGIQCARADQTKTGRYMLAARRDPTIKDAS